MNPKLIILVFAFIRFQTINSSILKNQLVNSENWIEIDKINFINEDIAFTNYFGNSPVEKEFTLNKSETVVLKSRGKPDERVSEVRCRDKFYESDEASKFCSIGNGRYQYELVKCRTKPSKGPMPKFECQYIAKVTNKNVQRAITSLTCNGAIFYGEPHKGNCAVEYSFQNNELFDEREDVLNDEI